jgi:hypothetical protein
MQRKILDGLEIREHALGARHVHPPRVGRLGCRNAGAIPYPA